MIYQPQVDSWKNDRLEARSAVMVTQPGQPRPAYGIVSLSARTEVDKQARMVTLEDLKVTGATFPAAASRQSYLADTIGTNRMASIAVTGEHAMSSDTAYVKPGLIDTTGKRIQKRPAEPWTPLALECQQSTENVRQGPGVECASGIGDRPWWSGEVGGRSQFSSGHTAPTRH